MSTSAASELWVWMNGEPVGRWQRTRSGGHRFVYEAAWLASPRARPLSPSLPITPDRTVAGPAVAHFFDNLLPDDERIRRRVSARFQVGSTEVFALLQAIGRDCVGAVQLLPPGQPPTGFDRVACAPMDEAAVARHLRGVATNPGRAVTCRPTICASPSPAPRKRPRCCRWTANGAAPRAPHPPRTSSSCRWVWWGAAGWT